MKKIILLTGLAVCFALQTFAQAPSSVPTVSKVNFVSTSGKVTDTVTNAATEVLTLPTSGVYEHFTAQLDVTKVSGTAAGVVRIFVSNTGVKYAQLKTDSLIVANVATQTKMFDLGPVKYLNYRLAYAGAGTQVVILQAVGVLRKRTAEYIK